MNLPLVSVVVTNRNYGRFLERAVRSIEAQSYPRREIVIVDDASTDDSLAIVRGLIAAGFAITPIRLDENVGQSEACRRGFAATRGEFVVFMDADDLLLPDFLKTHLFALACCQLGVAFSSSSMIHMYDGQAIRWNCSTIWWGVVAARKAGGSQIRDMTAYLPAELRCAGVVDQVHYCAPGSMQWHWAPTTSNCFRRDALDILFACPEIDVRIGFDGMALPLLGSLFGSVLIDIPISEYTIHGSNFSSSFAELDGARYWSHEHARAARIRSVDLIAANARRWVDELRVTPSRVVGTARAALQEVRHDLRPEERAEAARRIVAAYGAGGRREDAAAMERALAKVLKDGKAKRRPRRSWLGVIAGLLAPKSKRKRAV